MVNTCATCIIRPYTCFDKIFVIFRGFVAKMYKNFTTIYMLKILYSFATDFVSHTEGGTKPEGVRE
jgi:hypothetical protein